MKPTIQKISKSPVTPVVETAGKIGVCGCENSSIGLKIFQHIPTGVKILIINKIKKTMCWKVCWNVLEPVGKSKSFQHIPTPSNTKNGVFKLQNVDYQDCRNVLEVLERKTPLRTFSGKFFRVLNPNPVVCGTQTTFIGYKPTKIWKKLQSHILM